MLCYYHKDKQAVGSCKSCNKGLCTDCAVDVNKGLACRGTCEEDVRLIVQLIDQNIKLMSTTSRLIEGGGSARTAASIFNIACDVIFLILGLLNWPRYDFAFLLGICFLAYGLYSIFWSRRISMPAKKN